MFDFALAPYPNGRDVLDRQTGLLDPVVAAGRSVDSRHCPKRHLHRLPPLDRRPGPLPYSARRNRCPGRLPSGPHPACHHQNDRLILHRSNWIPSCSLRGLNPLADSCSDRRLAGSGLTASGGPDLSPVAGAKDSGLATIGLHRHYPFGFWDPHRTRRAAAAAGSTVVPYRSAPRSPDLSPWPAAGSLFSSCLLPC